MSMASSSSSDPSDEPVLFVVHDRKYSFYYTNEECAKRQLFDVTVKHIGRAREGGGDEEDEEDEEGTGSSDPPYLEVFGKGGDRGANLRKLRSIRLDGTTLETVTVAVKQEEGVGPRKVGPAGDQLVVQKVQ